MKVAITGANGHVGANLVRKLHAEGHEVRVLVHQRHDALNGLPVQKVTGDLHDKDSLIPFCNGVDVLYHLAAKVSIGHNSYQSLYHTNVEGTQNILTIAKTAGVRRFIHFSSIHAFAHAPYDEPLDENRPRVAQSNIPYEQTKAEAEEWVLGQQDEGFDVIVLNPTAIMGPYDFKPSFTGLFLIKLYTRSLPGLVHGGYNFVDVRDVCEAAGQAMLRGNGGEKYILSGHYLPVISIAELMQQVTGVKTTRKMLPDWLARLGVPFIYIWSKLTGQQPLYTRQSLEILQEGNPHILNDKARLALGFDPRPLSDTLRDTIEWFKMNKYIK